MGRSYNKQAKATNTTAPKQWRDVQPHKYCGKVDYGKTGKPNKAQKCDDCMLVKAQSEKAIQRDTSERRQEKMSWGFGDE